MSWHGARTAEASDGRRSPNSLRELFHGHAGIADKTSQCSGLEALRAMDGYGENVSVVRLLHDVVTSLHPDYDEAELLERFDDLHPIDSGQVRHPR